MTSPKVLFVLGYLLVFGLVAMAATQAIGSAGNFALDRIDQHKLPLDGQYRYDADGAGVHVYVIDNGFRLTHRDFQGRGQTIAEMTVGSFFHSNTDEPSSADVANCYTDPTADYDGHGTHTASFAVGATYGVAKRAHLHVLKVSGPAPSCEKEDADAVMHAVNWIRLHGRKPAVVNISLRPGPSARGAILQAIQAGFTVTLSAGCAGDVATTWGAVAEQQESGALVVASVDARDTAARTDYGAALTLFAPGIGVTGAGHASDTDASAQPSRFDCADSFAAPHVAGVAALYLQRHPQATPAQVRQAIVDRATMGAVTNPGASPNRLLYSAPATVAHH